MWWLGGWRQSSSRLRDLLMTGKLGPALPATCLCAAYWKTRVLTMAAAMAHRPATAHRLAKKDSLSMHLSQTQI
jgi:hypothetical protein